MESTDHLVWSLFLVLSSLALVELLVLPRILRSMLLEPEPMDAAGSAEFAGLYARQRRRRVLGMFWLMGVAALSRRPPTRSAGCPGRRRSRWHRR